MIKKAEGLLRHLEGQNIHLGLTGNIITDFDLNDLMTYEEIVGGDPYLTLKDSESGWEYSFRENDIVDVNDKDQDDFIIRCNNTKLQITKNLFSIIWVCGIIANIVAQISGLDGLQAIGI